MATAFNQPQPLRFVDPADMPDRYALPGIGCCMEPVLSDGVLLVFDKTEQPKPGDFVGLIFKREYAPRYGVPGWVKRLVLSPPPHGFSGLIIVEQLNPLRQYSIPTEHVAGMHKCIGTAQRGEDGQTYYRPAALGFDRQEA